MPSGGAPGIFPTVRLLAVLCLAAAVVATPAHAQPTRDAPHADDNDNVTDSDDGSVSVAPRKRGSTVPPNGAPPPPPDRDSTAPHEDRPADPSGATGPADAPGTPDGNATGISAQRRAAAIALAIVPGVAVHGFGAFTVRERRAARRILTGQLIGLGLAVPTGLLIFGSAGNPYTIPFAPVTIAGIGMLVQSWFTDIYVAAGGNAIAKPQEARALTPWSVELGTAWLHDAYRDRALVRGGGHLWLGRVGLAAHAFIDTGGETNLVQGDVLVRVLGKPATGAIVDDGSRLTVRAGSRWHRDDEDRVTQWTQELEIRGRLDLERFDDAFRNNFVELGTGVGLVRVKYGDDLAEEWSSELLGHFGWGIYLGSRGETKVYYEHTRDGLVGGFPAGRASGFVGYVGAMLDFRVYGPWALDAEVAFGNATLATLSLSYRGGPR